MAFKRSRKTFEADLQKQESPYVFWGTPLPPLDEQIRDDGSFVPIWKQDVTDDRGRKRLHGAFTGGFSAGYYNTVGSKEGWTPSTFVSSRTNRAKNAATTNQRNAEAFMDDEDLREAEESRHLQTSDRFSGFGTQDDEKLKGSLMDLICPHNSTIGKKLLERMGWREGQGIGPKVKRTVNLGDGLDASEDQHLFAPEDVSLMSFPQKNDYKGIGYESDAKLTSTSQSYKNGSEQESHYDDQDQDSSYKTKPIDKTRSLGSSKPKAKPAFGVGVLNDDGSDDEDPYSMGPRISYNRVIGGDKKPKKKGSSSTSNANPLLKEKPVFVPKKLSTLQHTLRKCHDGRLPLDGFVLFDRLDSFSSMSLSDEKYKPPEVPSTWRSSITQETGEVSGHATDTKLSHDRSILHSAKSRATILGEAPLPGKSVFDFLTPAARERLINASGKPDLPPGLSERGLADDEGPVSQIHKSVQELIPELDQETAKQALNRGSGGFMPYAEDDSKCSRYREFLEIKAGFRTGDQQREIPPRPNGMSLDAWRIELQEFARAAQVFKPISGLMASRFTLSTSSIPYQNPNHDEPGDIGNLLSKPTAKKEDPAEAAAKMGVFGPMTRSVINFYPTRLLCKRFNVPIPNHAASYVTTGGTQQDTFTREPANTGTQQSGRSTSVEVEREQSDRLHAGPSSTSMPKSLASMEESETGKVKTPVLAETSNKIDPEKNITSQQQRPSQAMFRAIFGSDDEDEDD